jgi:hypothetical protein
MAPYQPWVVDAKRTALICVNESNEAPRTKNDAVTICYDFFLGC